ncbi:MAG TPA: DMT family transporter [Xanthobacteraceae bacterium]|nr:DMT family transporter [Xanthobacteraceae bacterium]
MSFWAFMMAAAVTVASGIGLVLQQALNADLRVSLNSAAWAGLISYIGGTLCMIVFILMMRDGVPNAAAVARTHWFSWTGGLFGAIYIALAILLLQQLGAATFISLLVAGQMMGSLLFDHYGLFGIPQHPIDLTRLAGATLLIAGVVLIRL